MSFAKIAYLILKLDLRLAKETNKYDLLIAYLISVRAEDEVYPKVKHSSRNRNMIIIHAIRLGAMLTRRNIK